MAGQPINLQGLLRLALQQSGSAEVDSSNFTQMDDESKRFLESALKSMTVDVIEEFEKAIKILEDSSSSLEDKINALNVIREYIDNIDFANNFLQVGGSKIILKALEDKESRIRVNAIYIIAEMCQNNPFCQEHFIKMDVIPTLLSYTNDSEEVSSSALHAISSLVRSFEPGLVKFLENGGIKYLLSSLNTPHTRVFIKACFLIGSLSSAHPDVRDEFVKKSTVEKLSTYLEPVTGFDVKMESLLFALSELTKSPKWNTQLEVKENITSALKTIVADNVNLPECEEISNYAKDILGRIESKNTSDGN